MSTKLANAMDTVSGVLAMDIIKREGVTPLTLTTIKEEDWQEVGCFREGTFNITGDDITFTTHRCESGGIITSSAQDGTYGFEGAMPNLHQEIIEYLLKGSVTDVTAAASGAWVKDKVVVSVGDEIGLLTNCFVRIRLLDSPEWGALVFYNTKVASKFTGAGAATELMNISVQAMAEKSNDADTLGKVWGFISK